MIVPGLTLIHSKLTESVSQITKTNDLHVLNSIQVMVGYDSLRQRERVAGIIANYKPR